MATAALPRGRSLLGKASAIVAARKAGKPGRLAAVMAATREHVITFAALASADLGAWHWGPGVGWIVTGVSLLALDFAVRG
jgi:roadblock/LC7 domain-containing protein